MAEKKEAQVVENKISKSKKDSFMERFLQKYPDVQSDDEDAVYGKIGDEFDRFDRSEEAQKELGALLSNDPRSAGFLMMLRKGGNPMEYLIEQYGDDFREALNDEEKAKELSEAFSKYAEKQTKNKDLQSQAEANMQKMLDELDIAQEEGQFSDEDATNAYEYLYGDGGLLDRIITNDITKEDWMMLMKAANYDKAQSEAEVREKEARQEGEITGRNATIDMNKRKRTKVEHLPSDIAASGGSVQGKKQENEMLNFLNNRKRSVWEE